MAVNPNAIGRDELMSGILGMPSGLDAAALKTNTGNVRAL
jgi:hypothetical protein